MEQVVSELFCWAQLPKHLREQEQPQYEQLVVIIVEDQRNLPNYYFVSILPFGDNFEDNPLFSDESCIDSPFGIVLENYSGNVGDVLELSNFSLTYPKVLCAQTVTRIKNDEHLLQKLLSCMQSSAILCLAEHFELKEQQDVNNEIEELINIELLKELPNDLKYEIISFIPTYSKPERILLMERNVNIACKMMKISQDKYYEKYCYELCNLRKATSKLHPNGQNH